MGIQTFVTNFNFIILRNKNMLSQTAVFIVYQLQPQMQILKCKIAFLFKKPTEKRPDQKNITNFHSKQQLDFRQKARATISHTACAVCRIFVHVRKMR